MKRLLLVLIALSMAALAQAPRQRENTLAPTPPTYTTNVTEATLPVSHSDLYCAGFVTPNLLSRDNFVAAGLETPIAEYYGNNGIIFLEGSGYTPGTRVGLVRQLRDANQYSPFPGEDRRMKQAGHLYTDLGYAVVVEMRNGKAVARIEFACENIMPGDLVVPFVARPPLTYRRRSTMDRFPAEKPSLTGQIVAARDFNNYLGTGNKVYLNIGADKGLKPGDLLRVVRTYDPREIEVSDAAVYNATLKDDNATNVPKFPGKRHAELPRRVVGEVVILSTQPTTATAMITFTLEDVEIGDTTEPE